MPGKMLRFIALGPARTIGLLLLAAALFVKPSLVADDKPSPEQEAKELKDQQASFESIIRDLRLQANDSKDANARERFESEIQAMEKQLEELKKK